MSSTRGSVVKACTLVLGFRWHKLGPRYAGSRHNPGRLEPRFGEPPLGSSLGRWYFCLAPGWLRTVPGSPDGHLWYTYSADGAEWGPDTLGTKTGVLVRPTRRTAGSDRRSCLAGRGSRARPLRPSAPTPPSAPVARRRRGRRALSAGRRPRSRNGRTSPSRAGSQR
jgi:hypothetical protein